MPEIRIFRPVESETLHLPELRPLIGKQVEIIVRETAISSADAPASPYDAFFALAGQDVVDPEAYKELRASSKL